MKFNSNSETFVAGPLIPEKRLLAAVLQRAVTDFLSGEAELADGARSWIFDEEITDAPLSFAFICEALDLDPQGLKKAILDQARFVAPEPARQAAY